MMIISVDVVCYFFIDTFVVVTNLPYFCDNGRSRQRKQTTEGKVIKTQKRAAYK